MPQYCCSFENRAGNFVKKHWSTEITEKKVNITQLLLCEVWFVKKFTKILKNLNLTKWSFLPRIYSLIFLFMGLAFCRFSCFDGFNSVSVIYDNHQVNDHGKMIASNKFASILSTSVIIGLLVIVLILMFGHCTMIIWSCLLGF